MEREIFEERLIEVIADDVMTELRENYDEWFSNYKSIRAYIKKQLGKFHLTEVEKITLIGLSKFFVIDEEGLIEPDYSIVKEAVEYFVENSFGYGFYTNELTFKCQFKRKYGDKPNSYHEYMVTTDWDDIGQWRPKEYFTEEEMKLFGE